MATTFDTPGQHSWTAPDDVRVTLTLDGAGGGDGGNGNSFYSPGSGGIGGRVVAETTVSDGETLTVWVGGAGEAGGDATSDSETPPGGSGGTGWYSGGGGAPGDGGCGGGGGGAGATAVLDPSSTPLAVADGGGGASGSARNSTLYSGPGGGGGRGGSGGAGVGNSGGDGGGTGAGGDGANFVEGPSDGRPGSDGGASAPNATLLSSSTGGGVAADASVTIEIEPLPPQNLSITETTESAIDLAWDPPPTEDGQTVDEYHLYRALASGEEATDYTQIATLDAGTTTYTDTGLQHGERYYYRVAATVGVFV